jgi:hypothetical protein
MVVLLLVVCPNNYLYLQLHNETIDPIYQVFAIYRPLWSQIFKLKS